MTSRLLNLVTALRMPHCGFRRYERQMLKRLCFGSVFFVALIFLFSSRTPGRESLARKSYDDKGIEPFSSNEKISYEDYKLYKEEDARTGPGEHGIGQDVPPSEKSKSEELFRQNGYHVLLSDKMALNRSLKDIRHPDCKEMKYFSVLPTASIIIPFFEEHLSTLLRTFISAMVRAPKHLIKEVILVDDGSKKPFLKDDLDKFLNEHYPDGLVRVIRHLKREGLIRARLTGARAATGDVLIFLDSHCEANRNWLPPLLQPIAENYRTAVCPFIDVLDAYSFEYRAQDEGARGAFDWEFFYKRLPRLPEDANHPAMPFDSPVMAGGLFAIDRTWFWELGAYDQGLQIWGGEQYELSFKIWMCGGRMIDAPCSRIGHAYRHYSPFPNPGIGDFVGKNYKRVAEVWLDEYKEHIYSRRPHYRNLDPGDLTEQHALRRNLKCKSFKWFMTEIAFDLVKKYPLIDPLPLAVGDLRSESDMAYCVDATGADEHSGVSLKKCVKDNPGVNGIQQLEFTWRDEIHPVKDSKCFDVPYATAHSPVILFPCHSSRGNQEWKLIFLEKDKSNPVQLRHLSGCLHADVAGNNVVVKPCSAKSPEQRWHWTTVQIDAAAETLKQSGL